MTTEYNHDYNNAYEQAIKGLEDRGFNIIGVGEGKDHMYIITDTFKPLK